MRTFVIQNTKTQAPHHFMHKFFPSNPQQKAKFQLIQLSKFSYELEKQPILEGNKEFFNDPQLVPQLNIRTTKSQKFTIKKKKTAPKMPLSQKNERRNSISLRKAPSSTKDRYQKNMSDFPLGFYETPSVRLYNEHIVDERQSIFHPSDSNFFFENRLFRFKMNLTKKRKEQHPFLRRESCKTGQKTKIKSPQPKRKENYHRLKYVSTKGKV